MANLETIGQAVGSLTEASQSNSQWLSSLSEDINKSAQSLQYYLNGYAGAEEMVSSLRIASLQLTKAALLLSSAANEGSSWLAENIGDAPQKVLTR